MNQIAVTALRAYQPIEKIALNLAEEGVPVRAIARAVKVSAESLREIFDEAKRAGSLVTLPKDDWPSSGERDNATDFFQMTDETALRLALCRVFNLSNLQGALLIPLIKRKEVTREAMYAVILARRGDPGDADGGSLKIIDVMIYHLRKRLKKFDLSITTLWAHGFCMTPEDRQRVRDAVLKHFAGERATPGLTEN